MGERLRRDLFRSIRSLLGGRGPGDPPYGRGGPALGLKLELHNQARLHLWFEEHFGLPVPPLGSSLEVPERYASSTHAVAARLDAAGGVEIAAPYGIRDIFAMYLCSNRLLPNAKSHDAKARRCLEH